MAKSSLFTLLAIICILLIAANSEYLPYYFKIPVTTAVTVDTLTADNCAAVFAADPPADAPPEAVTPWSYAYIANGYVFATYQYQRQPTDEDVPSYLFVAGAIKALGKTEEGDDTYVNSCFAALNTEVSQWKRNFTTKCQRTTCGGSALCGCAPDQACKFTNDETKITSQDFCVTGYLCKGTIPDPVPEPEPEPEPESTEIFTALQSADTGVYDGTCKYGRATYKLTGASGFTDAKFKEIASSAVCSAYTLTANYALKQNDEIYFSTPSEETIATSCIEALTDEFGGELQNNNIDACKMTCGGDQTCLCGEGNTCNLNYGNIQCEDGLNCEIVAGAPICTSNSIIAGASLALLLALVALFF